ncbi:MAG: sarcosine oxidase subunit alpha [Gammaproteobacteria bacterium]|jgi:sarcosine oxidase subunit alpha
MGAKRLPPQANERIDRGAPLSFVFEGQRYDGFEGDVVSSALAANDQIVMARSFKYHRPRGILSFANHDANVLLSCGERTNIRADLEPLSPGKSYRAVNTFGGLRWDLARVVQLFAKVLPVGFYYKAFYRPRFLFPYWERLIRAMAGLGKISVDAKSVRFSRRNRFCDVLIIGGGVAGLAAAKRCVGEAADVVIVDENGVLGGTFDYLHARDLSAQADKTAILESLTSAANVEIFAGYFAAGFYADNTVPLVGPEGLVHVRAKTVIFATGLYEQPAVFRNNDLPGVMLASAAQRLVHRYAVKPCDNAVILAGNDEAYAVASDLLAAGIKIAAIVDLEDPNGRGEAARIALQQGIQIIPNAVIEQASSRADRLNKIVVQSNNGGNRQTIDCDGLLMSVGWAPAAGLLYQAGVQLRYDQTLRQVVPHELPPSLFVAGRVNGVFGYLDNVRDGTAAACAALNYLGCDVAVQPPEVRTAQPHSHVFPVTAHVKGKDFVDFDEDLTVNDLKVAFREGFDSVELMKRYTTIGMGPSQGKTSNMNGVRILADLQGTSVQAIGVTTTRPFTYPVALGVLAGRRVRRQWLTPMHDYHLAENADLQEAGTWLRPMSYAAGSPQATIEREYHRVRNSVGIIDVSTLGKIELFGPDTIKLLEYAYTCSFAKLKQGMTRYIFMVDAGGTLVDDGVAARFSDDHFYITATSSHAQAVVRSLQLFADQLGSDVAIMDRTLQVAALNLAGPRSREVLAQLTEYDISDAAFPYLAIREATIGGVRARLMRVGFVGELGFEIHVPASHGQTVWNALCEAGREAGIGPFGVEAQRLLRLEKGHLIFGQDTDGTTNPFEVNLGWGVSLSKAQFSGRHSLRILKEQRSRRMVGFITREDPERLIRECHLIIADDQIVGRVTSVAYSPHCQAVIGLAMLEGGAARASGEGLLIRLSDGTLVAAAVAETPFYDPDNSRQKHSSSETEQGLAT